MKDLKLAESDYRFMEVIWDNEPLSSMELVRLCGERLDWKKSTVFTMLRKMCDKGLAEKNNTVVTAAVRREEVQSSQSDYVINQTFHGSLPRFLAAFLRNRPLSKAEADELRKLIDEYEE